MPPIRSAVPAGLTPTGKKPDPVPPAPPPPERDTSDDYPCLVWTRRIVEVLGLGISETHPDFDEILAVGIRTSRYDRELLLRILTTHRKGR